MTIEQNRIASPCVRKCCLDEQDICLGCFRSLPEIIGWSEADDPTRTDYLTNSQQRRLEYSQKYQISW